MIMKLLPRTLREHSSCSVPESRAIPAEIPGSPALRPVAGLVAPVTGGYVKYIYDKFILVRYWLRERVEGCVMLKTLVAFARDESGATAIEYGLIAAGISVAIIAVINGLGTKLNTKFTSISTQLK